MKRNRVRHTAWQLLWHDRLSRPTLDEALCIMEEHDDEIIDPHLFRARIWPLPMRGTPAAASPARGATYLLADCPVIQGRANLHLLFQEELASGRYQSCRVCLENQTLPTGN